LPLLLSAVLLRRRAAERPPLSIDISCPWSAQQQTRRTLLQRSIDWTDKRTDGRTPDRCIDSASSVQKDVFRRLKVLSYLCCLPRTTVFSAAALFRRCLAQSEQFSGSYTTMTPY